jgi:pimeloyl-ACP methyl ester carboxylesterase
MSKPPEKKSDRAGAGGTILRASGIRDSGPIIVSAPRDAVDDAARFVGRRALRVGVVDSGPLIISAGRESKETERKLSALPDTLDFRDTLYTPTLIEVAAIRDPELYREHQIPVLDQGTEGACTGFALATVANYLLRARGKNPDADQVSAWMLYTMAKRYDEWPGEDYDGSSARGAMKGWHKHGLCALRLWQDRTPEKAKAADRVADAIRRPLGAYFRVNHKDLVAMHSALSEVGVLYATAAVHEGWQEVKPGQKEIAFRSGVIGGHAFAIVGYDRDGFWIQNSWGPDWGDGGLARLSYADWLSNGSDVWVAALGVPVELKSPAASASMLSGAPRSYEGLIYAALRPHIVTSRNDGLLDDKGRFGLTEAGLRRLMTERFPDITKGWKTKRLVLHAHGGLVSQDAAVEYVASNRQAMLDKEAYPISFIWRSDAWNTIRNILQDAFAQRQDEGVLDAAKDFMLDRLDDTLEPVARILGGKAMWDEMKENAERAATRAKGAAALVARHILALQAQKQIDEVHLVGHSAGSIMLAHLAQKLVDGGLTIASLSLWAPACTMTLFEAFYAPMIEQEKIAAFDLYTLDDDTEQDDDCAGIYHKSLLYLVSGAFEAQPRIPVLRPDGVPLLGLARDVREDVPMNFWKPPQRNWYVAPATFQSQARHHGDFDNDRATLLSTLARITGQDQSMGTRTAAPKDEQRLKRERLTSALGRRR